MAMSLSRLCSTRMSAGRDPAARPKHCLSRVRVSNPEFGRCDRISSRGRCRRSPFSKPSGAAWSRAAAPSFFTSWHWIGTLLAASARSKRPDLLRGSLRGETVALALLGAKLVRRRHGLIRSRSLFLNETGDPDYDMTIEHNGLLVAIATSPGRDRCSDRVVRRTARARRTNSTSAARCSRCPAMASRGAGSTGSRSWFQAIGSSWSRLVGERRRALSRSQQQRTSAAAARDPAISRDSGSCSWTGGDRCARRATFLPSSRNCTRHLAAAGASRMRSAGHSSSRSISS